MSESEGKELSIKLPGEWALQKAFGPVLTELGEDIKRMYAVGRDKILAAGYRKIPNAEDGKRANLRVTRDVMWNGAFTDDEVCAEYFGGILASSRSDDGKDDSSIQFVDVIKSLSSKQLRLHYLIYNSLNKILSVKKSSINVGQSTELQSLHVWLATRELEHAHDISVDTDFNILWRQGLLSEYETNVIVDAQKALPYAKVSPTTFGVLLYASAHNRLADWRAFSAIDFGNFESVANLQVFADTQETLKTMAGLDQPQASNEENVL